LHCCIGLLDGIDASASARPHDPGIRVRMASDSSEQSSNDSSWSKIVIGAVAVTVAAAGGVLLWRSFTADDGNSKKKKSSRRKKCVSGDAAESLNGEEVGDAMSRVNGKAKKPRRTIKSINRRGHARRRSRASIPLDKPKLMAIFQDMSVGMQHVIRQLQAMQQHFMQQGSLWACVCTMIFAGINITGVVCWLV